MKKFACLYVGVMICLAGCATGRLPNLNINEMSSQTTSGDTALSPKDVIALAEEDLTRAGAERLDYFAPEHLAMAEEHLKKARNLMLSGKDDASIITQAAFARKVVEKGLAVKQTVQRQLEDILDMKDRLTAMKAEIYFRDEFDDQMDHIKKMIHYIEKGDQSSLDKKKGDYLNEMLALEIEVVKKKTLSEAKDILSKARDLNAKDLAPKTYQNAENSLAQSTVFIESFPRDEKGVEKAGLESLRACQHVLFVTQEVIAIKDMGKDDFENLVLDFENKLHRITLSLGETDVRYMSLHDQSVTLSQKAEELQRKVAAAAVPVIRPATVAPSPDGPVRDRTTDIPAAKVSAQSQTPDQGENDAVAPAAAEGSAIMAASPHDLDSSDTVAEDSYNLDHDTQVGKLPQEDRPYVNEASVMSSDEVENALNQESPPVKESSPSLLAPQEASSTDSETSSTVPSTETSSIEPSEPEQVDISEPAQTVDASQEPEKEHHSAAPQKPVASKPADAPEFHEDAWDGSSETFNMDDLYQSDEERALRLQ